MILNVDRHPVDFGVRSVLDADRMDHTERWVLRLTSRWKCTLSSLRALMTDDTHGDLKICMILRSGNICKFWWKIIG